MWGTHKYGGCNINSLWRGCPPWSGGETGAYKYAPHKLCFFSIYSSGCVANLPRRAPYPWLQTGLKGRRSSKLLGDSTSTLSAEVAAGAEVLWLGEGGWRWVSAGGKGVSVQGLSEVEHAPGGFGGRTPLSVSCCTNPQSPGSELVELHSATVIQTVNKICG